MRAGRHDGCGFEHFEVCERHKRKWLLTRDELEALSDVSIFILPTFIMEVPAEFNLFLWEWNQVRNPTIPPGAVQRSLLSNTSVAIHETWDKPVFHLVYARAPLG